MNGEDLKDRVRDLEGGIQQLGARIGEMERATDARVGDLSVAVRAMAGAIVKKGVFADMAELVVFGDEWVAENLKSGREQKENQDNAEG